MKDKFTMKKFEGDDLYSWAIFKNGSPKLTGLSRREASYYRKKLQNESDLKNSKTEKEK